MLPQSNYQFEFTKFNHEREYVEWNEFVRTNNGSAYQLSNWNLILQNSYGCSIQFVSAKKDGRLIGILPLMSLPFPLSSRAVSLPYCGYSGPLVSSGHDESALQNLFIKFLLSSGLDNIEIRHPEFNVKNLDLKLTEATLVLQLPASIDMLLKQVGDKVRNQIKKGAKAGLQISMGHQYLDIFYEIYTKGMSRLGTPMHSKQFFTEILKSFGVNSEIMCVEIDGRYGAAMLILKFGDTWSNPYASSLDEFKKFNINMYLYFEAIKGAINSGAKKFDFGRSQVGSGTFKFKRQWGSEPIALVYSKYVDGVLSAKSSSALYRGRGGKIFSKAWSWLPYFMQKLLGPIIRRYIP